MPQIMALWAHQSVAGDETESLSRVKNSIKEDVHYYLWRFKEKSVKSTRGVTRVMRAIIKSEGQRGVV